MSRARSHLPMLAGWLFADLFLLLLITGLAATPPRRTAQPGPSPSTLSSPSSSSSPSPTPTPGGRRAPQGLDPKFVEFAIPMSPDTYRAGGDAQLIAQVEDRLAARNPRHRQVGFVLVFASDSRDGIDRAMATATEVVQVLKARSAPFGSSTGLGYWNGPKNNFELKVFFLN